MKIVYLLLGLLFATNQAAATEELQRLNLSGTFDDHGETLPGKEKERQRRIDKQVFFYDGKPIPLWCNDQKQRLADAMAIVPATQDPEVTARSREVQKLELANVKGEGKICERLIKLKKLNEK